jgi:hypothetical protein
MAFDKPQSSDIPAFRGLLFYVYRRGILYGLAALSCVRLSSWTQAPNELDEMADMEF